MRYTQALINSKNLISNLNTVKEFAPGSGVMAIVKANGYGHGIIEVSSVFEKAGVDYLGVAFPEEAVKIRKAGIKTPIVVLVPAPKEDSHIFPEYDIESVVDDNEHLESLAESANKLGKTVKLHLFVNTGMNRDGTNTETGLSILKDAEKLYSVDIHGLCTHFATSDDPVSGFTNMQLVNFNEMISFYAGEGFDFEYIHASNSAAIYNFPEARFNLVRPGIFLFGYRTSGKINGNLGLKPVLTFKTNVIKIRELSAGDTIGYAKKYVADKDTKAAIIPVGYGDGFPYFLTNKGKCLIRGKEYPLIGSVCMDQTMVNIGNDDINTGDEVVLLGSQGGKTIAVEDIAINGETITHEVLSMITDRVPRIII